MQFDNIFQISLFNFCEIPLTVSTSFDQLIFINNNSLSDQVIRYFSTKYPTHIAAIN